MQRKKEPADKPGSVVGNHSSGPAVTGGLKQPTRKHRGPRHCFPIWSCSRWGLPCRRVLPPARCALTAPFHPYPYPAVAGAGGIFSVALSVGSRPPGITWHPALWSPDFPPFRLMAEARLPGRLPRLLSSTGHCIGSASWIITDQAGGTVLCVRHHSALQQPLQLVRPVDIPVKLMPSFVHLPWIRLH